MTIGNQNEINARYQVDGNRPLPDEGCHEICVQVPPKLARRMGEYLDDNPVDANWLAVKALDRFLDEALYS